jgi:putative transposase
MKTKQVEITGTYPYPHNANQGKVAQVLKTLREYQRTATKIAQAQWKCFFLTQRFNKYLQVKSISSDLSERYKQTCLWQVYSVLNGYIASLQDKFARIVFNSSLSEEDKLILLALNSRRAWLKYDNPEITCYKGKDKVTCKVLNSHKHLAKKIFHHLLKTNRRPDFRHISMHLDEKVAVITEKVPERAKEFDYWLRLSTINKGNPVYIPLRKNSYAELVDGKFLKFIQIVRKGNTFTVKRVKSLNKKQYVPQTEEIALDSGLNPLFATNRGDLFGRNFLKTLIEFDRKIQNRIKYLQRKGIRKLRTDRKYCELVDNLREFLKSEVNRILNRIVRIYKPARLIIERLDFRSPELSRRMNRLIQNFGKRYIKEKLNRFRELYSIEIVEVNPAYTSQECSSCGYIDEKNRRDTHYFKCKACGKELNAQVNGARNISKRSSLTGIKLHTPKKQVLRVLVRQYLERLDGCNSAPVKLLKANPYFMDYLSNFKPLECGGNKCL